MSAFFDSVDKFFDNHAQTAPGILLEIFVVIYCFFALAIVCDEYLAPALETLCVHWRVREDVAGATFLAFGSAAPEIVINAVTTIKSQVTASNTTSLGISAIIGSGMLAFSFIPAMCCFASDIELKLKRRPLFRDEAFYLIALCTLCAAFHDGKIVYAESVCLVLVYLGHFMTVITAPWIRKKYRLRYKGIVESPPSADESFIHRARATLNEHRMGQRAIKRSKTKKALSVASEPLLKEREHSINDMENASRSKAESLLSSKSVAECLQSGDQLALCEDDKSADINAEQSVVSNLSKDSSKCSPECSPKCSLPTSPKMQSEAQAEDSMLIAEDVPYDLHFSEEMTIEQAMRSNTLEISAESTDSKTSWVMTAVHWITVPLHILFKYTCPPAAEGDPCEALYGLTFGISMLYVAAFSFILSSVIGAWVSAWRMPQAVFGMLLIAVGAEIPDTIQSVTMARKAYGSMAVSNCQGTQVINIGIGLGLPWLMTNVSGKTVTVCGRDILQISAVFQIAIVLSNFILLPGWALMYKEEKVVLEWWKAAALVVVYVMAMLGFIFYLFIDGQLFQNTCS